jgi:hypothetical protein
VDRLLYWAKQDEWWLSMSAMYTLSKKRSPAEVLPHASCYAKTNLSTMRPELKAAIEATRKAEASAGKKTK